MLSDVYDLLRIPKIPFQGYKGIAGMITKYDAHIGDLFTYRGYDGTLNHSQTCCQAYSQLDMCITQHTLNNGLPQYYDMLT